mmetsp:Transcript_73386/g.192413  ORF Transcript_73386/g.192413 Transcript_73386/m.192413 type:complete len:228 (-) Transcript_73386:439-1122(-)
MATSLGWRDVGSVLLSKADAERTRGDRLRGDGSREEPIFQGEVVCRRVHREVRVDEDLERDKAQAASFPTDLNDVIAKRPDSRLKWLQKALFIVGKKQLKASTIYEIITHKRFLVDVKPVVGAQMKALLLANGHLFSPKQQKYFESNESAFSDFSMPKAGGSLRKKKRKRSRSSSSSSSRSSGRDDRKRKKAARDSSPAPEKDGGSGRERKRGGDDARARSRGSSDE